MTAILWAGTVGWGLILLVAWWYRVPPPILAALGTLFLIRLLRELGFIESEQVARMNSFTPLVATADAALLALWKRGPFRSGR